MSEANSQCAACSAALLPHAAFCQRCGQPVDGVGGPPEPHPFPQPPSEEQAAQIAAFVERSGFDARTTDAGWSLQVPLAEDRGQQVHVLFSGLDDAGTARAALLSLCGPLREDQAPNLLRRNATLTCGQFAVRTIRGSDYFVLTRNCALAELEAIGRDAVYEMAAEADAAERRLGDGRDMF